MLSRDISSSQDSQYPEEKFSCFLPTNDDFDLSDVDRKKLQSLTVPIPENEAKRLLVLRQTKLLDSDRVDASFDRFTDLVKRFFNVSIALISLVDIERQWFKSTAGDLDASETPRNFAFCAYTVLPRSPDVFVVEDSHSDPRFRNNPLVTGPPFVRFYAGAALVVENVKVGSLCLIDRVAHPNFSVKDRMNLLDLGAAVSALIEERRSVALNQNQERAKMMLALMHNLRAPLSSLHMAASILHEDPRRGSKQQQQQASSGGAGAGEAGDDRPLLRPLARGVVSEASIRDLSLNDLRESVGQLKVLIESSLSLGQIIVGKSSGPSVRDDRTAYYDDGEGSIETEGEVASLCDVPAIIREARQILLHYEAKIAMRWEVDMDGILSEGPRQICAAKIVYFVILRVIDQLSASWNEIVVTVYFRRTNRVYDTIQLPPAKSGDAGADSRHCKYVTGLLHLDFAASKPRVVGRKSASPDGHLDFYSIEQVLGDFEGGSLVSEVTTGGASTTSSSETGEVHANSRGNGGIAAASSTVTGKLVRCWLPCGVSTSRQLKSSSESHSSTSSSFECANPSIADSNTKSNDVATKQQDATDSKPGVQAAPAVSLGERRSSVSSQSAAPTQNSAIPAPVDAIPQESKKAKESDTASAEAAREASSQGSGQLRILLVEDCVSIQKLMSRWLRSKDCHVTIAANGKIGLQFLTSQRFDVAFMDFLMPVMLGTETMKLFFQWAQASPDNCINSNMLMIGLSANATVCDLDEGFVNGMHFFCQKPAETNLLGTILNAKKASANLTAAIEAIRVHACLHQPVTTDSGAKSELTEVAKPDEEKNNNKGSSPKKWKLLTYQIRQK